MLAYRARYYVGVLTYLFNVAVYYFIWRAVFSHSPTVVGLSLAESDAWRSAGRSARSTNEIDRDIAAQVGRAAGHEPDRPVDFQTMMIADAAANPRSAPCHTADRGRDRLRLPSGLRLDLAERSSCSRGPLLLSNVASTSLSA
jgi:hypothetical protein